jgi:endonuclease YncB( thermonuclease family)
MPAGPSVVVDSVTDGDTIVLRGGRRVRLVQIDTPEVYGGAECGGRAASRALTSQLPRGSRVRLVADPATDRTDRYDRLLRYVYLGARNLNVWMVARGHATPYFYDGERGRFAAQLERSARRARAARLGLWGACPNAVLDAYRGVETGPVGGSGSGGASDAATGAGAIGGGTSGLPLQPAGGPDVDCSDLSGPVRVTPGDPHRLDADGDGIGCDS